LYWSGEGWQWREKKQVACPAFWNQRKWTCPNAPVVGVSWYEAMAFCHWADVRLPTENEWQAAAQGFKRRLFPWGRKFRAENCNCKIGVNQVDRASAVGSIKAGDTPEGLSDMAGNVFEWTNSHCGSNGKQVVRGISWSTVNPWSLRCAFRCELDAGLRNFNLGFRCAR
jgi:formylglycine-generating enzyme required for sulfatase activity